LNDQPSSKPRIEKLRADHAVAEFDCDVSALNRFLKVFALPSQRSDSAQTYVALIDDNVVGYYSLTVGDVVYDDAPDRLAKGLPRHPVPVLILARLAVDRRFHGRRLGQGLLRDALLRTIAAADIAGIRGVVVHAKDEMAKTFYERFGFAAFPAQPLVLFRLLKDIRSARA